MISFAWESGEGNEGRTASDEWRMEGSGSAPLPTFSPRLLRDLKIFVLSREVTVRVCSQKANWTQINMEKRKATE